MTINADDKQIAEVLAFLKKLGISEQNYVLAQRYLNGDVGAEVLDQFERRDLDVPPVTYEVRHSLDALMNGVGRSEKRQVCIRLFDVLFAIGHSTCSALFSGGVVHQFVRMEECELYKSIVVFIEDNIRYNGYMHGYDTQYLMEALRDDTEKLKEIIAPVRAEGSKYLLFVLSLYFGIKNKKRKAPAADDMPLMREYEDVLLDDFDQWLVQNCSTHVEIAAAIRSQQLTAEMLDGIRRCSLTQSAQKQLCFMGSMAFSNFHRSDILRDIVRACLAVSTEDMLYTFSNIAAGAAYNGRRFSDGGQDYDELFWIEPETYIRWAAVEGHTHILKRQLDKNQEGYLRAMDEDGYSVLIAKRSSSWNASALESVNRLKDVLKSIAPRLYEQTGAGRTDYERVMDYLVNDTPHAETAREYLRGNCRISQLYPYADELKRESVSVFRLNELKRHSDDAGFFDRCKAFMVLCSEPPMVVEGRGQEFKEIREFFQMLDREQMDLAHQLGGFATLYKTYDPVRGCTLKTFVEGAANVFARYLKERRQETTDAFSGARVEGRYLALVVMRRDTARNKQEILSYASDSAKLVKEELFDILYRQKDWEDEIKALLDAKKAAQRELAIRVLLRWQQEDGNYNEVLLQAVQKEKNTKLLGLLKDILNIQDSDLSKEPVSKEDLVEQIHKGNRKRSLEWAYEKPFAPVHRTNGREASVGYLQAILLYYASQDKCGISKNAELLAEDLDAAELARYVNELFDRWLVAGAESRRRWVLYAASIHGGEDIIQKMQHQIQEWPQMARGAVAAEAVKALSLNPSPRALLLVDGIARKFQYKQVRAAAGEALEFAATELGITREELCDRIVPDFGFDEDMQRTFDYGERVFKVTITTSLEIEVFDENGKKLKSMPTPGKNDDTEKAAEAYEAFKQMKKQMKATAASQKARLEYALCVRREWSVDAWKALFVKNPLMHQFAIGLIWGVYENGKLVQGFRYMEDGSFNTQDGEEYGLPGEARISLVHPLELSDGEKAVWKEQLADYEIKQPVEQLDRTVYHMTEKEAGSKCLERFGGCILNGLSLDGKLTGFGWYRGPVQNAGCFHTYYREDAELGIGAELHFSGTYLGRRDEDVTLYEVWFYNTGSITHGSDMHDGVDEEKAYLLEEVPPRYFSEIVLQLTKVTALSEARDEDWKKGTEYRKGK